MNQISQLIEMTPGLRKALTKVYDLAQQNIDHGEGICPPEEVIDCDDCSACVIVRPFTEHAEPDWFETVAEFSRYDKKTMLPAEEFDKMRESAARWDALMSCDRIRVIGYAKLGDPKKQHMGVEFWSTFPSPDDDSLSRGNFLKYIDAMRDQPEGFKEIEDALAD